MSKAPRDPEFTYTVTWYGANLDSRRCYTLAEVRDLCSVHQCAATMFDDSADVKFRVDPFGYSRFD